MILGHENAYVRSSSAAAIVEGIEHWSENTAQTISALEEHYRDKVGAISRVRSTASNYLSG